MVLKYCNRQSTYFLLGVAASIMLTLSANPLIAQTRTFTNLQALPANSSDEELDQAMIANLRGLGLPRRQNSGCLYCHEGDMEVPSSSWDYAADTKLAKRKAREMMVMVREINARLQELESRVAPDLEVTCYTCHAGRTDPRPLRTILTNAYQSGGVESTIARYRVLRDRYYGGDAYDFRFNTLASIAGEMAGRELFDDAIAISRLNEEMFEDEPNARSVTVSLQIRRVIQREGLGSGLTFFDEAMDSNSGGVMNLSILDGIGWTFFRSNRQQEALQIFRKNLASYADEYIANESLGDALWLSGNQEDGIAVFEAWLVGHPDHDMARRRHNTLLSRQ